MVLSDFKPGDSVLYIPLHAHGDMTHKDCEDGVVSSVNAEFVFVKYGRFCCGAKATYPYDLVKR